MLDRLVTAVDSQIVSAGETLGRAVGGGCRAVQAVLQDVTKVGEEREGEGERPGNYIIL